MNTCECATWIAKRFTRRTTPRSAPRRTRCRIRLPGPPSRCRAGCNVSTCRPTRATRRSSTVKRSSSGEVLSFRARRCRNAAAATPTTEHAIDLAGSGRRRRGDVVALRGSCRRVDRADGGERRRRPAAGAAESAGWSEGRQAAERADLPTHTGRRRRTPRRASPSCTARLARARLFVRHDGSPLTQQLVDHILRRLRPLLGSLHRKERWQTRCATPMGWIWPCAAHRCRSSNSCSVTTTHGRRRLHRGPRRGPVRSPRGTWHAVGGDSLLDTVADSCRSGSRSVAAPAKACSPVRSPSSNSPPGAWSRFGSPGGQNQNTASGFTGSWSHPGTGSAPG